MRGAPTSLWSSFRKAIIVYLVSTIMEGVRTKLSSFLRAFAGRLDRGNGDLTHDQLLGMFEEIARHVDKHHINGHFVKPGLQREFEARGFHLIKNHFYSPIPTLNQPGDQKSEAVPFLDALGLEGSDQFDQLFDRVISHAGGLKDLPRSSDKGFYWNNPMFPPLDAIVYYGIIRELKPKRIIEIGCGFSTEIALLASSDLREIEIECIEPYPSERFKELIPKVARFIPSMIQQIPAGHFEALEAGDILFIDTAHVTKRGSDVNHIIFSIIPHLKPGVIVHIHDVFLPYDYPESWLNEIGIMWNEQYVLLAMLMAKGRYLPILLNYYLSKRHVERLSECFKGFDIWDLTENLGNARGASLWFEVHG